MIYLIVANQIMEVLTDVATGRKLIVTADGKATDMDANMRAVNR